MSRFSCVRFYRKLHFKSSGLFHFHSYQFKLYMYTTFKSIRQYTYSVNDKLGDGCSSQVYRGRHQKTHERVAIKIIPKAENIEIAQNEIKCLQNIKGIPRLLQLLCSSQTKNNIYIITNICEGGTLYKLIRAKGKLSEEQALIFLKQIIQAFEALAKKRIIHRDLKPSNIFLDKNEQVVIGDFGFAVQLEQNDETFLGNAGSPYYMAPEVLIDEVFSLKSDIWAIGVIYLEMLTGQIPWKSRKESELKKQLQKLELNKYIPKNLSPQSKEFLKRTLEKQVNERMTVQELVSFSFQQCENQDKKKQSLCLIQKVNSMSTDASNKSLNYEEANSFSSQLEKKEQNKSPVFNNSSNQIVGLVREQSKTQLQKEQTPSITKVKSRKDLQRKPSSKILLVHNYIIKQIEAQINFFGFLYKIYQNINECIKNNQPSINSLSQHLLYLVFDSLNQIKGLNRLTGFDKAEINQFKFSSYYEQILNSLKRYIKQYIKLQKKEQTQFIFKGDRYFLNLLKSVIQIFYQNLINCEKSLADLNRKNVLIFLIEDMLKLYQIYLLSKNNDWEEFAEKSNLAYIMQQQVPQRIGLDYWQRVRSKCKEILQSSPPI